MYGFVNARGAHSSQKRRLLDSKATKGLGLYHQSIIFFSRCFGIADIGAPDNDRAYQVL
jgi:hypothetical protein